MNIAPRAFLGFALIGALMLALGVFALSQMSKIRTSGENIVENSVPSVRALNEFTQLTLRLRVLSYRLLTNREADTQQKTFDLFEQRNQQIRTAQSNYEKLISAPEERAAYDQYVQLLNQYRQLEERMKTLSRNNQVDELRTLLGNDLQTNSEAVNAVLARLTEINNLQAEAFNKSAAQQYSTAFTWVVTMLIVATGLTLLFAWLLTNSITKPIANALDAAEEIAKGNLTRPITVDGSDEAGRLLRAMATMQDKLRDTLQRISGSATQLASAAEELNSVTDESARGLTQQNNEIEQAATAVNEMTSAVEEVARNAVSTSEASRNATTSAGDGRDLVQETVGAIERMSADVQSTATLIGNLADESRDIGKVLDVIRGLADQTNLLALNAAIEAARAGEAGRGFAVVADEVRALAHRTQQSTSEIERMIGSIQSGTEQAATAVNEMTSAVEEVARNAVSTSEASRNATTSAGDGRDLVQETVGAIERMSADVQSTASLIGNLANESRDIGKVLDVIRGLADQTNLLALNAAIEAARAGEAGRGFAVVADEVRALAHRTQQSTSEIERMIGSIQSGTEQAVDSMRNSTERAESTLNIARGAGMSLDTINSAIVEINERNLVIASAAEEQAQVAREVDRNLVNIRDLSVQSATGANQTSAASAELSRLAVDLNSMVGRFSL